MKNSDGSENLKRGNLSTLENHFHKQKTGIRHTITHMPYDRSRRSAFSKTEQKKLLPVFAGVVSTISVKNSLTPFCVYMYRPYAITFYFNTNKIQRKW